MKNLKFSVLIFSLLLLAACSGVMSGVKGSDKSDSSCRQAPNIDGRWEVLEKIAPYDCPIWDRMERNSYVIVQSGCKVTIGDVNRSVNYEGVMEGNVVSLKGQFPEPTGLVMFDDMTLTLSVDGNSMSGVCPWTHRGVNDCTGKTHISAKRVK